MDFGPYVCGRWLPGLLGIGFLLAGICWSPVQAQEAPLVEESPARPFYFVMVSGVVWSGPYSEIQWQSGGRNYSAVSNWDFTLLDSGLCFSTETGDYSWLISAGKVDAAGIATEQQAGRVDAAGHPVTWPASLPLAGGPAQFILLPDPSAVRTLAETAAATAPIQALHEWIEANRSEIIAGAAQRAKAEAERAAREAAELAANPPSQSPASVQVISIIDTGIPNELISRIVISPEGDAYVPGPTPEMAAPAAGTPSQ